MSKSGEHAMETVFVNNVSKNFHGVSVNIDGKRGRESRCLRTMSMAA
jgi:hypothetical protein